MPAHVMERFVENQAQQLANQSKELDLEAAREANSHEFNMAAMDREAVDRTEHRQGYIKLQQHRYYFIGGVSVVGSIVIVALTGMGHPEIAIEIFKAVAFLGAGSAGGYFYGKSRGQSEPKG